MKILPTIEKLEELYHKKRVLRETERDFNVSISSIRKKLFLIKPQSTTNLKYKLEYSDLEYSMNSAIGCLNDIKERIKAIKKDIRNLSHLYISWNTIVFYDGYIKIVFEDYESENIIVSESKSCFNYIKVNIIKKLKPLEILCIGNHRKIVVVDKITFRNAIMYLSIKDESLQDTNTDLCKIKEFMNKINDSHNFLSLFFDKSLYLEFLAKKQSSYYRIIPTEEKIKIGNSQITEDSFIFTINTTNNIYIIWENINKERATFIFKTLVNKYNNDLQIVFDYIASHSMNKRRMLYLKQSDYNILNSCTVLYHSDYRSWENKMEALLV